MNYGRNPAGSRSKEGYSQQAHDVDERGHQGRLSGTRARAPRRGYLVRIGHDDPRTFCSLLGRVIPREVGGPDGEPIKVQDVSDLELARRLGFILARGGDDAV